MSPAIVNEPFTLASYPYSKAKGSAKTSQPTTNGSTRRLHASHASYDKKEGYVTLAVPQDGLHVFDLADLHPVTSHSLGPSASFACPPGTRVATPGTGVVYQTYAAIASGKDESDLTNAQSVSCFVGTRNGESLKKTSSKLPHAVFDIHTPEGLHNNVIFSSPHGDWTVTDSALQVVATTSSLPSTSSSRLSKTFVLATQSCTFAVTQHVLPDSFLLISILQDKRVRVSVFTPEQGEIVGVGEYTLPADKSEGDIIDASCSNSEWLSVLFASGAWHSYELSFSYAPSTPSDSLQMFQAASTIYLSPRAVSPPSTTLRPHATSLLALNTSHVLLASASHQCEVQLLLWDLQYGVLVASHVMPLPSAFVEDSNVVVELVQATESQALLLLSGETRSSALVVPFAVPAQSTIAAVIGRAETSEPYLTSTEKLESHGSDVSEPYAEQLRLFGGAADAKSFETSFFNWVRAEKDAAQGDLREVPQLGSNFVKKVVHMMLSSGQGKTKATRSPRIYSPKVMQYLLERRVISSTMVEGGLLTALRTKRDWTSIRSAFQSVVDLTEDEVVSVLRSNVAAEPDESNAMDVDTPAGGPHSPGLDIILGYVVNYAPQTSAPALRLALRKHMASAEQLTKVLTVLDVWVARWSATDLQGAGTFSEVKPPKRKARIPPLDKVIAFVQVLLDCSFLTLLQHRPAHAVLRGLMAHLEPEVELVGTLEGLSAPLEQFAVAQKRASTKKDTPAKDKDVDWRRRKRELREKAAMAVGVYQVEELTL
ncbi:hypothetical protein PUNSTDRAFT_142926 [Punctularia strigosozonata HHB-11173 SS5]|uniref:uncharacterized protein n=1 Tax=Punctularia strigosozonata (strain HHB-11173) TaxID=741275 RepID=UPI000441773C|nr:uncharacterized protein PUNSTDRAFT_142926 [Punctularia strigosozonata HHB-11173 SS5]EIN11073.1 hypothetical protein PUNSTDRAFT_142926 [Punctularia strigosozonata HHB-11173 SS5]